MVSGEVWQCASHGLGHSWLKALQAVEDFRATGVDLALPLYQRVFFPFFAFEVENGYCNVQMQVAFM